MVCMIQQDSCPVRSNKNEEVRSTEIMVMFLTCLIGDGLVDKANLLENSGLVLVGYKPSLMAREIVRR